MQIGKIVILDNNDEALREYSEYFKLKDYKILSATSDGLEGLKVIKELHPDVVVMNLTLKGIDGFGILDELRKLTNDIDFVVLGSFGNDDIIRRVMERGAKYYLLKPVSAELLEIRVKELISERETNAIGEVRETRRVVSIDEKISSIFISVGIPPHIKGYNYLREGIKMAVERPEVINNVTKVLYPNIALKYDTTPSKVERAIRHAIEVAWNRGRTDAISAIFGMRVYIGNEKPTNSEFIALVADKLILESYR